MDTVMVIITDTDTVIATDIIMECGQDTGLATGQDRHRAIYTEIVQMVYGQPEV